MDARVPVSLALLAVLGAVLAWAWSHSPDGEDGTDGVHGIRIVGPEGWVWEGEVAAPRGNALDHLRAAGAAGNFSVEVEDLGRAFGDRSCSGQYVTGIGGHRETATGGWNFYVQAAGAAEPEWQPHSAACHVLEPGDDVVWTWVEGER